MTIQLSSSVKIFNGYVRVTVVITCSSGDYDTLYSAENRAFMATLSEWAGGVVYHTEGNTLILKAGRKVEGETSPTTEPLTAKAHVESVGKLTGQSVILPDGRTVKVERSNGFVLSGFDFASHSWWAHDLRHSDLALA